MAMNDRGVRIRGAILIVLGLALTIGMAWILGQLGPIMEAGPDAPGARFTGTAEQAKWINVTLVSVLVFGIVFGLYGLFMTVTGKQSRVMRIVAFGLLLLLLGAALATGWTPRGLGGLL